MAESARHIESGQEYFADEIVHIEGLGKDGWACLGCNCDMTAVAALGERVYKRPPHFKGVHLPRCNVDGDPKTKRPGPLQPIRNPDGPPADYPNQLVLATERIRMVDEELGPDGNEPDGEKRRYRGRLQGGGNQHARYARSLRRIAEFFAAYPELRALPLGVPGVAGTTYETCFAQLLPVNAPTTFPPKIYFARLANKDIFSIAEDAITVTLYPALFVDGPVKKEGETPKRVPTTRFKVRVSFNQMPRRRNAFENELHLAIDHADENPNQPPFANIFFMGHQSPVDPFLFEVTDSRLACFVIF